MNIREVRFAELVASGMPATATRIIEIQKPQTAKALFMKEDNLRVLAEITAPIGTVELDSDVARQFGVGQVGGGNRGLLKLELQHAVLK